MRRPHTAVLAVALAVPLAGAINGAAHAAPAAGGPGTAAHFDLARKDCVGTAHGGSKIWFTVAGGVLSDVYEPTIDNTNVESMRFAVTDGRTFTELQGRDTTYTVRTDPTGMACTVTTSSKAGRYRLVTTYVTDPKRDAVVVRTRIEARTPLRLYVRLDTSINGNGGGGTANAGADSGYGPARRARGRRREHRHERREPRLRGPDPPRAARRPAAAAGERRLRRHRERRPGDAGREPHARARRLGRRTATSSPPRSFRSATARRPSRSASAVRRARRPTRPAPPPRGPSPRPRTTTPPAGAPTTVACGDRQARTRAGLLQLGQRDQGERGQDLPRRGRGVARPAPGARRSAPATRRAASRCTSARTARCSPATCTRRSPASSPTATWTGAGDRAVAASKPATARRPVPAQLAAQRRRAPRTPAGTSSTRPRTRSCWPTRPGSAATPRCRATTSARPRTSSSPTARRSAWSGGRSSPGTPPRPSPPRSPGLVAGGEIADRHGDSARARLYRATADQFQRSIKGWTVTTTGPYGDGRYFIRLSKTGDPNAATSYGLGNGSAPRGPAAGAGRRVPRADPAGRAVAGRPGRAASLDARRVIGVRRRPGVAGTATAPTRPAPRTATATATSPTPPPVLRAAAVADRQPGSGHLWPVLSGERGRARAAGRRPRSAAALLDVDEPLVLPRRPRARAGVGGPGRARVPVRRRPGHRLDRLRAGQAAGSASPLTWAQAQVVRLARGSGAGRPVEQPAATRPVRARAAALPADDHGAGRARDRRRRDRRGDRHDGAGRPGRHRRGRHRRRRHDTGSVTPALDGTFSVNVPVSFGTTVLTVSATTTAVRATPSGPSSANSCGGTAPWTSPTRTATTTGRGRSPTRPPPTSTPGAYDLERFQVIDAGTRSYLQARCAT